MLAIQQLRKTFYEAVRLWISDREFTIQVIQGIIDKLEQHHRSSTSFFGRFWQIVGAITPTIGIPERMFQTLNINFANEQLQNDYEKLDTIRGTVEQIKNEMENLKEKCPHVTAAQFDAVLAEILAFIDLPKSRLTVDDFMASTATEMLKAVLPTISLIEFITSSAREPQTSIITQMRGIVKQLEEQKQAIKLLAKI